MPFFALSGVGLAIGHHFTYANLEGQNVSENQFSQQAVKQIGNAFVALVLGAMKIAVDASYNQYAWTIVKRRSFPIGTFNKLFSLLSVGLSFLSLHLLRDAKFAYLLGAISWYVRNANEKKVF
jgi:hypothetical protein